MHIVCLQHVGVLARVFIKAPAIRRLLRIIQPVEEDVQIAAADNLPPRQRADGVDVLLPGQKYVVAVGVFPNPVARRDRVGGKELIAGNRLAPQRQRAGKHARPQKQPAEQRAPRQTGQPLHEHRAVIRREDHGEHEPDIKQLVVVVFVRLKEDRLGDDVDRRHAQHDIQIPPLSGTQMDEFAMGSTTETSAFGATKNPWNTEHVPGGSSGGSCAAVAAEEVPFALGSDTGGSIRQPSSFCGVTGIKPTYGTVSRYGLIAYGSSLDQIGPIAKDVTDCATILEAIASYDKKDSTSVNRDDLKFTEALVDDVKGMKIGIPKDYFGDGLDPEVKSAILAAADVLKEKGAIVEEFDLGLVEYAIPAYYVIACAEASSNLARFDGVKYGYRTKEYTDLHNMYKKSRSEGFGPEVKRRIMLGSFVLSSGYYDAYYLKALRVKALIKKAFDDAFAKYDVILGPAAPTTAPKLGESLSDPIQMYLGDIYTISVNLAGLPGISLPCGMDKNGLPIGLQLIGDCFKEKNIIRAAYSFEKTRELKRSTIAEEYSNKNTADTNKSAGAQ